MDGYVTALFCIGLVLSPLAIPVGITIVDWIGNRRVTPDAAGAKTS
jgi:hypothetical protein